MALRGIDVSNWQNGIALAKVPGDIVIMKATQGTGYLSPDFARQYAEAKGAGKLLGAYHYVGGRGAAAEAEWFVKSLGNRVGECLLCIDWESEQNSKWGDLAYLEKLCAKVMELTDVVPVVYCSKSSFPWDLCSRLGLGTWVAQYASMNLVDGYQDKPWNEGAYSCDIRQYASNGRLSGYSGALDLNKAYMTAAEWKAKAAKRGAKSASTGPSGTALELCGAVMAGEYGNGEARKKALGSRYTELQSLVNHALTASVGVLATEVIAGKWGNGTVRKRALGSRYAEVQAAVNKRLRG